MEERPVVGRVGTPPRGGQPTNTLTGRMNRVSASVWPMPVMLGDLGAFVGSTAVDPTNLPFLLFVGATLAALGRIGSVRRRLGQPFP